MRRPGRRLTAEEARAWAQVARTVRKLDPPLPESAPETLDQPAPVVGSAPVAPVRKVRGRVPPPLPPRPSAAPRHAGTDAPLDGSWERRIAKGALVPDFSLDLHGATLDQAYTRLMHGLTQARAMGARVVLVVTGKPRPVDAMDRGERRGAIRAKIADWLSASEHAGQIVALRGAHPRHGGTGAIYLVLKKQR